MEGKDAKNELLERMNPSKALALMALPTVASQMILLVYNLADTWFIGRTNDPYMVGAASIISAMEPVTCALLGAVFLEERLTLRSGAGICLIVGATVYLIAGGRKAREGTS